MNKKELINNFLSFIDQSPTIFQVSDNIEKILLKNDFIKLEKNKNWKLEVNEKYFIKNSSSIIAFEIGQNLPWENGFNIIASHVDSPNLRIKANPEIINEYGYITLNVETYGGIILSTWFDKILSIAGQVILKDKDNLIRKTVVIDEDLCIIPNLAIHMDRQVNEGHKYDIQKEVLPLIGMKSKDIDKGIVQKIIAKELNCNEKDIVDFDLFLYPREKSKLIGINKEFISAPRLDNLAMVHSSLMSFIDSKETQKTKVYVAFDNEEVGSTTYQGACSPMLSDTLKRIVFNLKGSEEEYFISNAKSFIISADMAHALHPNYLEKADIINRPIINKGPVIKTSASKTYVSDAFSISIFKEICKKVKVNCQIYYNNSNIKGGSTLGPLMTYHLNIPSVDIGNPLLAMHSSRELGGVQDHFNIYKCFKEFFNE